MHKIIDESEAPFMLGVMVCGSAIGTVTETFPAEGLATHLTIQQKDRRLLTCPVAEFRNAEASELEAFYK